MVKTLWPGQPGTLKLGRLHGPDLVCVRYRHDECGLTRYTTVELVVDAAPVGGRRFDQHLFAVRTYGRRDPLARQLRKRGARWNQAAKVWIVNGATIRELKIEDRVCSRLKMVIGESEALET